MFHIVPHALPIMNTFVMSSDPPGVQSVQWLGTGADAPEGMQLLASGGSDGSVKVWAVHYQEVRNLTVYFIKVLTVFSG